MWVIIGKGTKMFKISLLATAGLLLATAAFADDATQEFSAGKDEYQKACAACHGGSADGNGELATMFKSPIPDLTGIAKRNDGVFPLLSIIQAIDGRAVIRGHGNPMPVFGNRYRAEADQADAMFGSEAIARGRVLELALYIQSIQE
jgi:mono/diheme cytochrome c family protein